MWGHQGPDARWAGNEEGYTGNVNWHTINRTPDDERLGEAELELGVRDGKYWTPAEANARIRDGWFWHEEENPKAPESLLDMYMKSQGRGVNLLLNVGPDNTGQMPAKDLQALTGFRKTLNDLLQRDVSSSAAEITATSTRGNEKSRFGPENTIDGQHNTYWTMNDDEMTGAISLDFGAYAEINGFVVQEHIALGQRIGGYSWDALLNGTWVEVVNGVSMGYKRIDQIERAVVTSQVRLRITQSNAVPAIERVQVLGTIRKQG
jgi:alpha-L-fucosidase